MPEPIERDAEGTGGAGNSEGRPLYEITVRREGETYYAQCCYGGIESHSLERALATLAARLTEERFIAARSFGLGEYEAQPDPTRRLWQRLMQRLGSPTPEETDQVQLDISRAEMAERLVRILALTQTAGSIADPHGLIVQIAKIAEEGGPDA